MNEVVYEKIADALVDDGYIIIEDALTHKLTQELLLFAKDETHYKKAGISSTQTTHVDINKRSDKTQWLNEGDASESEYLAFSEGLRQYLNRHLYLGLNYYEAHFSIYNKGDFYEMHMDAFTGNKNRVVTTLFYLNEEWNEVDEGELVLYNKSGKELEKISPKGGTLVVFMSDKFPHKVLATQKKRHSIAGWFREDSR